jgi:hypothetical protein
LHVRSTYYLFIFIAREKLGEIVFAIKKKKKVLRKFLQSSLKENYVQPVSLTYVFKLSLNR